MPKTSSKKAAKKTAEITPKKAKTTKPAAIHAPPTSKPPALSKQTAKIPKKQKNYYYANGKRKTSVAMVRLYVDGKGTITVNDRVFEKYFPILTDQDKIHAPLRLANAQKLFDISVKVHGGGVHSQAEAVRHGISKALLIYNPEFRSTLKAIGFLTRDSRIKERKKYGLKRARRAPQWQKR